jgi:Domain of unknown function (DUF5615)
MRILLDECIDSRLAREFVGYAIKTVPQMGWAGIKDGQLLALAAGEFDIFITVDRNLSFQQNIPQFDIAVIVLEAPSNRLAISQVRPDYYRRCAIAVGEAGGFQCGRGVDLCAVCPSPPSGCLITPL